MRLLETSTFELKEFFDAKIPKYAILSHRWGEEEVTFKQMLKRTASPGQGLDKIQKCCSLAASEGFRWVWIDTCCIDKRSSAELTEAINSMYKWYQNAAVCYVHLSDVHITAEELRIKDLFMHGEMRYATNDVDYERIRNCTEDKRLYESLVIRRSGLVNTSCMNPKRGVDYEFHLFVFFCHHCSCDLRERFRASSWFTRGWTLQELVAPRVIVFYDANWHEIGTRAQLSAEVATMLKYVTEREVMLGNLNEINNRRQVFLGPFKALFEGLMDCHSQNVSCDEIFTNAQVC